jgi:hypothetical protein
VLDGEERSGEVDPQNEEKVVELDLVERAQIATVKDAGARHHAVETAIHVDCVRHLRVVDGLPASSARPARGASQRPRPRLHLARVLPVGERVRARPVLWLHRRLLRQAAAEAFWATLKRELGWIHNTTTRPNRADFRSALFDYIEGFYKPNCIQRRLGHHSPADYEQHSAA